MVRKKEKKENCSNVSNSMLTDERQVQRKKIINYTGIRPEQFWGKSTIHDALIY